MTKEPVDEGDVARVLLRFGLRRAMIEAGDWDYSVALDGDYSHDNPSASLRIPGSSFPFSLQSEGLFDWRRPHVTNWIPMKAVLGHCLSNGTVLTRGLDS